jgi:hypothetical protein
MDEATCTRFPFPLVANAYHIPLWSPTNPGSGKLALIANLGPPFLLMNVLMNGEATTTRITTAAKMNRKSHIQKDAKSLKLKKESNKKMKKRQMFPLTAIGRNGNKERGTEAKATKQINVIEINETKNFGTQGWSNKSIQSLTNYEILVVQSLQ